VLLMARRHFTRTDAAIVAMAALATLPVQATFPLDMTLAWAQDGTVERTVVAAPDDARRKQAACFVHYDGGSYELAIHCLRDHGDDDAKLLRAEVLAQVGRWDEAAKALQELAGGARGERSVVLARRINAWAEVEVGLAALAGGKAKDAVVRLQSARVDAVSHARFDAKLKVPAALDLALGLALRAAGNSAEARARLELAAQGGGLHVPGLARAVQERTKAGSVPWPLLARSFGDAEDEQPVALAPLPNGGLALVARANLGARGGDKLRLWALDAAGRSRWNLTRGGGGDDVPMAAVGGPAGVIVAGSTTSQGAGDADAWLVQFNARHEVVYDVAVGGPGREVARAVAAWPDGSALAAGARGPASQEESWLARVDATGAKLWDKALPSRGVDRAEAVVALSSGTAAVGLTSAGRLRVAIVAQDGTVKADVAVAETLPVGAELAAMAFAGNGYWLAGTAPSNDSLSRRIVAVRTDGELKKTKAAVLLGDAPTGFVPALRPLGSVPVLASATGLGPTLAALDDRGRERAPVQGLGRAQHAHAEPVVVGMWGGKGLAVAGSVRREAGPRDVWLVLLR
jgi:hypothetical protein